VRRLDDRRGGDRERAEVERQVGAARRAAARPEAPARRVVAGHEQPHHVARERRVGARNDRGGDLRRGDERDRPERDFRAPRHPLARAQLRGAGYDEQRGDDGERRGERSGQHERHMMPTALVGVSRAR
jgi:hypothetical protein